MNDPKSRLRKLAKRIDAELREEYRDRRPLAVRRRRLAARYLALVTQTLDGIGTDPKATPRKVTALQKAADGQLAMLRAHGEATPHGKTLSAVLGWPDGEPRGPA